ncbi:MAG: hypothetical protein WC373_10760 [Smithella sp.]
MKHTERPFNGLVLAEPGKSKEIWRTAFQSGTLAGCHTVTSWLLAMLRDASLFIFKERVSFC